MNTTAQPPLRQGPFQSKLLTEHEAADFLRLSVKTLRKQRCEGAHANGLPLVPFVRLGRAVRYDLLDLQRFVESCKAAAGVA